MWRLTALIKGLILSLRTNDWRWMKAVWWIYDPRQEIKHQQWLREQSKSNKL